MGLRGWDPIEESAKSLYMFVRSRPVGVRMMEDEAGQRPKKRVKFLLKPLNGLDPSKLRQPRGASDGATRMV